ncbi:hypothetical protein RJ639_028066 [Escallonia herrerae]|uniref:U1-type domain-containing protein n=1 Tax=Escallonia herrerae TaxID=1293975 RepID=A0AA88X6G7_9ASTE|nr:hypothetical protein RJ639_028066 [Escallonia herrerae]
MDFSKLPEAQQQQLQQLQHQFQEHLKEQQQQQQQQAQQEAQQQQQYQDYASQSYDPSQAQPYDQSYYSYYGYQEPHQQQPHAQNPQPDQQQQQQQYGYGPPDYQPGYTNAYAQPEPSSIHPQGIAGLGQAQHQQNAYYPQQVGPGLGQGESRASPRFLAGHGSLNPAAAAAVVALTQLTQFAGSMDAAERAMAGRHQGGGYGPGPVSGAFMGPGPMHYGQGPMRPPVDSTKMVKNGNALAQKRQLRNVVNRAAVVEFPYRWGDQVGQSPYRGGGRRGGGGPFRGGGRGSFGSRPPRGGGSGPPFRGRGRGRGRGDPWRYSPYGASSSSHPKPSTGQVESTEEQTDPSADNHGGDAQAEVPAAATNQQPIRVAWCELCRVDCTSLEILEQHKNGKRHKKNLQRLEELKSAYQHVAEIQNEVKGDNPEVTESVQVGEEKKQGAQPETLPTEAVTDKNNVEAEQKNDKVEQRGEEQSNLQERKPWMNRFEYQRHGMKRKMRGGRGGKLMKTPRRPIEPPKPKVVIPLICDLCNVKCDTQEVFDRHLSGKKHISKLKRFEGHQAMYGPVGLQALYPPNPIAQTLFHPQGPQQGHYGPQGSYPPPGSYMHPQAVQAAAGTDSHFQQNPCPQVADATSVFGEQKALQEVQQQPASVGTETNQAVTVQSYGGNSATGSEATVFNHTFNNTIGNGEQVKSVTLANVPAPGLELGK